MYKKIFMGIAAMAALTLVSCSSDDLNSLSDNSSKNEAISFDGYLGRSAVAVNGSRGSVETKDQLKTDGFGVFGNYNSTGGGQSFGSNLFDNVKVKGTTEGTEWTYDGVKYWPSQGHIDFLAYAPYVQGKKLTNNTSTNKTSCIEFDVKEQVADQKDLLWAKADGKTKDNISNDKNKVKFQFAHALSRLGYTVKLKGKCSSDATITLKKIILAGSATEPTTGAFYTKGTIDLSTGNWISPSGNQYFNWYSAPTSGTSETSGIQSITFTSSTSDKTYKNKDNEYLFVIPQNFNKGTDKLYVIVEYDIKYNSISEIITNKVSKQLTPDFAKGKAYTINLTIGRPIEFDADVTDWTNTTDNKNTDINIDSWE